MDNQRTQTLRVLHSFPHRLGMSRICTIAWHEIDSVAATGANMLVMAGDSVRPFTRENIKVTKTITFGKRIPPYRILGTRRMCILHDWLVAKRLPKLRDKIDIIHAWPLGAKRTMKAAKKLGIPVALERCNAHTKFAYESVRKECERIGVQLPAGHEHAYDKKILNLEEEEYNAADGILCPSKFVIKTFMDEGFAPDKMHPFFYGVDEKKFYPATQNNRNDSEGLTMIYVGVCAVRKGLHLALDAWLNSPASRTGKFLVVGGFIPSYQEKLHDLLAHPSVEVLGHREDVPELMRKSDIFVLPSIEEGFGLVCTEAMASGCVPLVSDACTDLCQHMKNSLVHRVGDTAAISEHITRLDQDRSLLHSLRDQGLADTPSLTWEAAGRAIVRAYRDIILRNAHKLSAPQK